MKVIRYQRIHGMQIDSDDLDRPVWAVKRMAKIVNLTERQTFHLVSTGKLPANKVGERWVSTKRKLLGAIIGEVE